MGRAGEEGLEGPSGYLQGGLGPLRVGSKLGVELQVGAEALQSLSPVPSFQVGKQLSAWVRTTKELPQNCSSAAFHPSNPDPWVVLLPLLQMENAGTGPRPQVSHWQTQNMNLGLSVQCQKPRRPLRPSPHAPSTHWLAP